MEAVVTLSLIPGIAKLNEEELNGYEFVKLKGEVSKKNMLSILSWDERKALRQLSKMKSLALIGDNGEASNSPGYRYVIAR